MNRIKPITLIFFLIFSALSEPAHSKSCGSLRCHDKASIEEARACRNLYEECMKNWFKEEVERMGKRKGGLNKKQKDRFVSRLQKKVDRQREKNLDSIKLLRILEIQLSNAKNLETHD